MKNELKKTQKDTLDNVDKAKVALLNVIKEMPKDVAVALLVGLKVGQEMNPIPHEESK